jgi:hypothetical protein
LLKYRNPAGRLAGFFIATTGRRSTLALEHFCRYTSPMLKTGAIIVEQATRGQIAFAERSRALTSLLLLGLTRGCRVL